MMTKKTTPKPNASQAPATPATPITATRPDRIMRLAEVQQRIGIRGKSTIYRWVQHREFPAPLALGGGSVGWRESDIDAWIASRPPVILPTMAGEQ